MLALAPAWPGSNGCSDGSCDPGCGPGTGDGTAKMTAVWPGRDQSQQVLHALRWNRQVVGAGEEAVQWASAGGRKEAGKRLQP